MTSNQPWAYLGLDHWRIGEVYLLGNLVTPFSVHNSREFFNFLLSKKGIDAR